MENKQEILGQYFTKIEIVRQLLNLLFGYKKYNKDIKILEPSFGTGNFIKGLNEKKYLNIDGCEIDKDLTKNPCDFFEMPLAKKYDLLIGNPPFSKYNLKESYFSVKNYIKSTIWPSLYLTKKELKNNIVVIYENSTINEEVFDIKNIHEELIPQVIFHKNNGYIKNDKGIPLKEFFENKNVKVKKSYKENNISASNILEKNKIPLNKAVDNYKLAIVRVGNASVGKCGLVNIKDDILNDMFYIFDVKDQYKKNKQIKEIICQQINKKIDYFRNITCRIVIKSIKKEDILNLKITA